MKCGNIQGVQKQFFLKKQKLYLKTDRTWSIGVDFYHSILRESVRVKPFSAFILCFYFLQEAKEN